MVRWCLGEMHVARCIRDWLAAPVYACGYQCTIARGLVRMRMRGWIGGRMCL